MEKTWGTEDATCCEPQSQTELCTKCESPRAVVAAQLAAACREMAKGFTQMESEEATPQDWLTCLEALAEIASLARRTAFGVDIAGALERTLMARSDRAQLAKDELTELQASAALSDGAKPIIFRAAYELGEASAALFCAARAVKGQ